MKVDNTFELFDTVVAAVVDGVDEEVEAAILSTDIGGLFVTPDMDEDDVGEEFVATFNEGGENEPLFSFSLDVVSLFEFDDDDEMILFCRFLVSLANWGNMKRHFSNLM